jgi:hypothetical protein
LARSSDQRAEHHRGGASVIQCGVGRRHIQAELLHQPSQTRRLSLGQLKDEPRESRGVDDRVLQRAFEPPTNEPAVEGVVAVLDQNGALGEPKERPTCVAEFRRSNQHRPVDVMTLPGIGIDRRPAIDEGVEEGMRARKLESLGAQLQHEERGVACRFDVDGDELRIVQQRLRAELWRVDGNFLPGDRLRRPARLQVERLQGCRLRSADRTKSTSSRVTARSRMAAAA